MPPGDDPDWPFVLSAGERRSFTANTIMRDPWRKRDPTAPCGSTPADAAALGLVDGGRATVTTKRGAAEVDRRGRRPHAARATSRCPTASASTTSTTTAAVVTGVAPNELTATADRDPWAGTPWHKYVPARLEPVP